MHSHLLNTLSKWLRALDGLNKHFWRSHTNAIGGQAILIKLRLTADSAPTYMLLENPYEQNRSVYDPHGHFRYRQMKHVCGENPGYDADLLLWDSHPSALGATPQQVWIDRNAQIATPHLLSKLAAFQEVPNTLNFDKEVEETLKHEGLPSLEPTQAKASTVVFTSITSIFLREEYNVREAFMADRSDAVTAGMVVVEGRQLSCFGSASSVRASSEIDQEASTQDGYVLDPLTEGVPEIVGGSGALIPAADGLQFSTRDALLAYRAGVTTGIVAPQTRGFLAGLNTAFSTGTHHKLEKGAVVQEVGAVHVAIHPVGFPSITTQIAALRHLLLDETSGNVKEWFRRIKKTRSADFNTSVIAVGDITYGNECIEDSRRERSGASGTNESTWHVAPDARRFPGSIDGYILP
ncbi:hypothetical protein GSI_10079 [Ganoderma sinense ZZ0214-1]|uniref:Uncharacterized protein n=1 Tax=Ganoderma sinense ZZ0214-1 TaxID=1077348 RepID=A0A2G8RZI8_9APHY|nr:hypothetical protein GSI_10079 [Ganoderma sinense ZZ0214-1]